jgi:hypothetical protein
MMLTGSDEHNLTDALTLSRVAVYPVNAHGLQTPPLYSAGNNSRGATSSIMRFESSQGAQRIAFNELAEATGGKAFFNSNGLKEVLAGIVGNGSSYYTLAYATTNKTWNSQFRHIKLLVDRPGVRLQNRQGYYAIDRQKQEQRLLASWQKHKNSHTSCCEEPGEQLTSSDETGALIKHPNGGLRQAMALGVVTPTEVIVKASLAMGDQVVKLEKNAPLPTDNYLDEDYRDKPFRTYSVQIQAGMRGLRLTQTPDGMRHDTVEFVTLVLDSTGGTVNSQMKKAVVDVNEELYQQLVASGLPMLQQIAVPVQGNFFLRIGVHDVNSGHIGTVEIPVDQIHPGVSGQGLLRP